MSVRQRRRGVSRQHSRHLPVTGGHARTATAVRPRHADAVTRAVGDAVAGVIGDAGADATGQQLGAPWQTIVVRLPAQLDESTAAGARASLLLAADRRPHVLIADMSGTRWCDWAGAGAVASAFSRALASGTELRVAASEESVRRVLSLNGLDRMMSVCPDVTAASALPPSGWPSRPT